MHRNQAYSHLVELATPRHVLLSIHAHNNKGPKLAILLLPQATFKPLTSFDGLRITTKYNQYNEKHHLHVPTPWHNFISCQVESAVFERNCSEKVVALPRLVQLCSLPVGKFKPPPCHWPLTIHYYLFRQLYNSYSTGYSIHHHWLAWPSGRACVSFSGPLEYSDCERGRWAIYYSQRQN